MRRLRAVLLPVLLATGIADAKGFTVTADYFDCLTNWPKIRNTRIFHPNRKKLRKAIRVFERGKPNRRYPVGTVLQLVPFEAMVKHRKRFYPDTDGWEFFALGVTAAGTTINSRGSDAINFLNLPCQSCHAAAARFDWVCEQSHGCIDIGLSDTLIANIQNGDPRCQPGPAAAGSR